MYQKYWEDVYENDLLAPVEFPLSMYRMVMAAGAVRDFSSIHHNGDIARRYGAADMFVNYSSLLVMWERCVREYIGLAGVIKSIKGFRMRTFNVLGDNLIVSGNVLGKWRGAEPHSGGYVELAVRTESMRGVTVGPGRVIVTLPFRSSAGM